VPLNANESCVAIRRKPRNIFPAFAISGRLPNYSVASLGFSIAFGIKKEENLPSSGNYKLLFSFSGWRVYVIFYPSTIDR